MEDDSWSIAALRDVNSLTDRIIPSHVRISAAGESHRAAVPGRARHLPGARSLRTRSNKLILMVSAERLTYISFTHLRSSLVKSSTADRQHSNFTTVLCSACIIGLNVYGAKRPLIGNLPSRRTIMLSKETCLS
jgi:hypothetical protein